MGDGRGAAVGGPGTVVEVGETVTVMSPQAGSHIVRVTSDTTQSRTFRRRVRFILSEWRMITRSSESVPHFQISFQRTNQGVVRLNTLKQIALQIFPHSEKTIAQHQWFYVQFILWSGHLTYSRSESVLKSLSSRGIILSRTSL